MQTDKQLAHTPGLLQAGASDTVNAGEKKSHTLLQFAKPLRQKCNFASRRTYYTLI